MVNNYGRIYEKKIFVITFLTLFIITGCGETKNELDKFKSYLTKKYNYECSESVCTLTNKSLLETAYTIDFNQYNFLKITTSGENYAAMLLYNWNSNTAIYSQIINDMEMYSATYDFTNEDYNCVSNLLFDENWKNSECQATEKEMRFLKEDFEKFIKESGTTYFDK